MPPTKRKAPTPSKAAAEAPVWTVTGSELVKAFQHIIYSLPQCHDQWFADKDWCAILPDYWSSLKNYRDQVTTKKFVRAIKKHFGDISGDRGETNPSGVYYVQRNTAGPKGGIGGHCFLITKKDFCPLPPSSPHFFIGEITNVLQPLQPQNHPVSSRGLANNILKQTYFDSGEAWKMFMPSDAPKPKDTDPGKSTGDAVKAVIKDRMLACQSGMQNFWEAIEGGTKDDVADVSDFKRRKTTYMCHAVYAALRKALESMDSNQSRLTWSQCCDHAVEAMKVVGFDDNVASSTVKRAHLLMRDNNNKFPHPNEKARKKKAAKEAAAKEEEGEEESDSDSD
eukprot:scaffold6677_cov155-Skeletonema_menzelii.AAC.18